ncbi:hypothetical protein PMAYCL1PPCAC_24630, partial [Pristionchus mayeri]
STSADAQEMERMKRSQMSLSDEESEGDRPSTTSNRRRRFQPPGNSNNESSSCEPLNILTTRLHLSRQTRSSSVAVAISKEFSSSCTPLPPPDFSHLYRRTRSSSVVSVKSKEQSSTKVQQKIKREASVPVQASSSTLAMYRKRIKRLESLPTETMMPRKRGRPCKDPIRGPIKKRTVEQILAANAKHKEWRMKRKLLKLMSVLEKSEQNVKQPVSSRASPPVGKGIVNRFRASSVLPMRGRPPCTTPSRASSVPRQIASEPKKRGRPPHISLPVASPFIESNKRGRPPRVPPPVPSPVTPSDTNPASSLPARTIVEKRRAHLKKRDEKCRKALGLHYEGKKYCMAKQGTVDEGSTWDYVQEILDGYKHSMEYWKKKEDRMAETGNPFETDFVVGCTAYKGNWDEAKRRIRVKILMKFTGFPYAHWNDYDSSNDAVEYKMVKAIQEFRWREALLSKVRKEMREECETRGEDFDQLYPHVFLPKGEVGTYATDEAMKRRTLFRAREATINEILKKVGVPPIIVEEWTGNTRDDNSLFEFVFTVYVHLSKKVQKAEREAHGTPLKHKCGVDCCCAGGSSRECHCCPNENDTVECNEDCACTIEDCPSRIMQRGRKTLMAVIRHPVKGWTTRALEDIPEGTYVGDYAGEMLTAWENKQLEQTYSTDLPYPLVDRRKPSAIHQKNDAKVSKNGGYCHRPLAMTALRKGNEGRWHSHSCDYNMQLTARFVSRKDWAFARLAFFTVKDVKIGQELTWNYHGDKLLRAISSKKKFRSDLIPRCVCGSSQCMIKPWDECSSDESEDETENDSFSDGEEIKPNERKKVMKKRRKRKVQTIIRSSDEENEFST